MCFLMILPVVQCYLFCTCIGRDPQGLKLGVVNEELKSGMSSCSIYPSRGCNFSIPLSCRYLQNLKDKSYKLVSNIVTCMVHKKNLNAIHIFK